MTGRANFNLFAGLIGKAPIDELRLPDTKFSLLTDLLYDRGGAALEPLFD